MLLRLVGRTARAGRGSEGVTLVTPDQQLEVDRMARKLKRHAEVVKVGPSAERTREGAMANKDKGGAKNKKAASKTLKEKREAKKAKSKDSDRSGFSSGR